MNNERGTATSAQSSCSWVRRLPIPAWLEVQGLAFLCPSLDAQLVSRPLISGYETKGPDTSTSESSQRKGYHTVSAVAVSHHASLSSEDHRS